jgi:hypothetical protein
MRRRLEKVASTRQRVEFQVDLLDRLEVRDQSTWEITLFFANAIEKL